MNKKKVDLSKLDELSGDAETRPAPRFVLPSIKLNANKDSGNYFRTVIEDEELKLNSEGRALLEDMGKTTKGIILKVRKTYFHDGADSQLYTNETGANKNEKVSVFCKTENTKGGFTNTCVFAGTPAEIKERYPELKMIQIIYFLLEETGEIVRLKVKGMSLPKLFDYFKSFESYERKYEFITELGSKAEKNKFGSFYAMTFKRGKRVEDLSQVEASMQEIYDKITEIEEYYKDYNQAIELQQIEVPFEKVEEKPVTNEDVEEKEEEYDMSRLDKEEEIDVKKDIPF